MAAPQSNVPSRRKTARVGTRISQKQRPRWRALILLPRTSDVCGAGGRGVQSECSKDEQRREVHVRIVVALQGQPLTSPSKMLSPACERGLLLAVQVVVCRVSTEPVQASVPERAFVRSGDTIT